jgi:hypothetical protein
VKVADEPSGPAATGAALPVPGGHADLSGDLQAVVMSLHDQYDWQVGPVIVQAEIQQVADRFTGARIRSYVPLFVRRFSGKRLRDRALVARQIGSPFAAR